MTCIDRAEPPGPVPDRNAAYAHRLRIVSAEAGCSAADACVAAGLPAGWFADLQAGRVDPGQLVLDTVYALADVLHVDVRHLLPDHPAPSPPAAAPDCGEPQ